MKFHAYFFEKFYNIRLIFSFYVIFAYNNEFDGNFIILLKNNIINYVQSIIIKIELNNF